MSKGLILVVDDEPGMRQFIEKLLIRQGYAVVMAADGQAGLGVIRREPPDLILTDIKMPGMDGMAFLGEVKVLCPDVPVIMMTAFGAVETAIKAMKLGAYDYINKPFDIDQIMVVIEKALEKQRLARENILLRQELNKSYTFESLISQDRHMQQIFMTIRNVADAKSHVLIQGDTGTGKELVARAIHNVGAQKNKPFVPVDCAALTESLLETELFGHVKGAFTGAVQDKKGLLETAEGGTVFLDEIGHVPMETQVKLLRVLQDSRIKRVGDTAFRSINVRVIAAANEDLKTAVQERRFREDLYFRLNVILIELPNLRERIGDIPLLVRHFIQKYNHLEQKRMEEVSPDALNILMGYNWPGNVRELENLIHRLVVIKKDPVIQVQDLPEQMSEADSAERRDPDSRTIHFTQAKKQAVNAFESRFFIDVLTKHRGNVSRAAQEIGLDRRNFQRKLKHHHIDPRDYLT